MSLVQPQNWDKLSPMGRQALLGLGYLELSTFMPWDELTIQEQRAITNWLRLREEIKLCEYAAQYLKDTGGVLGGTRALDSDAHEILTEHGYEGTNEEVNRLIAIIKSQAV